MKIYSTDLDEGALNTARHATYLPRDVESVPEPLLEKYFEHINDQYLVSRDLRKSVIFGRHNIVHDAPISRIDLLVCRNLLIYLETETQNPCCRGCTTRWWMTAACSSEKLRRSLRDPNCSRPST